MKMTIGINEIKPHENHGRSLLSCCTWPFQIWKKLVDWSWQKYQETVKNLTNAPQLVIVAHGTDGCHQDLKFYLLVKFAGWLSLFGSLSLFYLFVCLLSFLVCLFFVCCFLTWSWPAPPTTRSIGKLNHPGYWDQNWNVFFNVLTIFQRTTCWQQNWGRQTSEISFEILLVCFVGWIKTDWKQTSPKKFPSKSNFSIAFPTLAPFTTYLLITIIKTTKIYWKISLLQYSFLSMMKDILTEYPWQL